MTADETRRPAEGAPTDGAPAERTPAERAPAEGASTKAGRTEAATEGAPTGPATEPAPLTLVYLDVDDEITSAASRIRGAGADEVALVLPFGSRLATSRINFRLLAREAGERGKKLEIITADTSARSLAAAAGLPIHASVAAFEAHRSGVTPGGAEGLTAPGAGGNGTGASAATPGTADAEGAAAAAAAVSAGAATGVSTGEQLPLPSTDLDDTQTRLIAVPRRSSPRVPIVGPPRPPVRTGVAIGVGIAVVVSVIAAGLLALEFLPTATITLHPRSEPIGPVELLVEAREDVTAPDPASLLIPAERFTFELEAMDTFPATGTRIEEVKSRGHVTFSNFDTGRAVRIESGAVVTTKSGIAFETQATVTLPSATIQFPFTIVPSTSTVEVEAVEAGPDGNVGNNTIVEVPKGENKRLLQVTNLEATSGGARNETPEVSEEDVEAAKEALVAALAADLTAQVAARDGVPAAFSLFPSTARASAAEYSVDPDSLVGDDGSEFQLGATAEGSALGVDPAPIAGLAEAQLGSRVDAGWSILPGSVTTTVGAPDELAASITYPVTVSAMQVHDVDQEALLTEIRGLGLPEARSRLDDFGDVAIEVWPDWVTKVPNRADRVTFSLAEPQPSAPPS